MYRGEEVEVGGVESKFDRLANSSAGDAKSVVALTPQELMERQMTRHLGLPMPWVAPNVSTDSGESESEQLRQIVEGRVVYRQNRCGKWCSRLMCALTGFGLCYMGCKTVLVEEGEYGFALDSGKPKMLLPGWHLLDHPCNSMSKRVPISAHETVVGPVSIIRILDGHVGMAYQGTELKVMLPGTHAVNDGLFRFEKEYSLSSRYIRFNQIKFITVPSGHVAAIKDRGRVLILTQGRYTVNSPNIDVPESVISIQDQNLKFEKHTILLAGGISILVEGLMTYRIVDAERMILGIGLESLVRALTDTMKAELCRVFSVLHLEELGNATYREKFTPPPLPQQPPVPAAPQEQRDHKSMTVGLSSDPSDLKEIGVRMTDLNSATALALQAEKELEAAHDEKQVRIRICQQIIDDTKKIFAKWGVEVVAFNLESTKLADPKYAADYEACSLQIAKAKANLAANAAQNRILIQQSLAEAQAVQIRAEAAKCARVVDAKGIAEALTIEAAARQAAGNMVTNPFAQEIAFRTKNVEFAQGLKATTLVVNHTTGNIDKTAGGSFGDLASKIVTPVLNLASN